MPESIDRAAARTDLIRNVLAGLTVSFVAISLGAAFGILSGRGAFAGIISAGIIALVTSGFGGTRIQCSGPTAPMTAVTAVVVAFAHERFLGEHPGADPDQFVNLTLILAGVVLVLAGTLRLGRYIKLVPRVVVSGFMDGIAILIWVDQLRKLFGWGGKTPYGGDVAANVAIALVTALLVLRLTPVLRRRLPRVGHAIPGTLVVIVAMSALVAVAGLDVERVSLQSSIKSLDDLVVLVGSQIPRDWSAAMVVLAAPFAVQLALLAYLDTLLTSLVVDKLTRERTAQDRELVAQGMANGAVALVGGIPGAQATIRSVLIVNEGATARFAGVLVGVFVLIEMLLFQDMLNLIPQAVFSGVLFKVGYDVFDWQPLKLYLRPARSGAEAALSNPVEGAPPRVTHGEMLFIAGTAAVTVLWSLNAAVIAFTIVFYVLGKWYAMTDLAPVLETEGIGDED
ncbi:MAG TPA: SulP family inorganic anion transporter [Gemmatimonadales bacterium]|jgi:SulP family sulfate permease